MATGKVSEKSNHRGRPQKLTPRQQKWLLRLIESEPTLYLDELAIRVSLHNNNDRRQLDLSVPRQAQDDAKTGELPRTARHLVLSNGRAFLAVDARERRDDLRWNFIKRMADKAWHAPSQRLGLTRLFVDCASRAARVCGRDVEGRENGWGVKGDAVEVSLPLTFVRGQRYSVLAAVSWESGVVSHSHVEVSALPGTVHGGSLPMRSRAPTGQLHHGELPRGARLLEEELPVPVSCLTFDTVMHSTSSGTSCHG